MIRAALLALGLLFCVAPPAHAIDWPRCTEHGYLYHFDPRLAEQPCELVTTEVIHWRGGTSVLHVIHPRSMPAINNLSVFEARVHQAAGEIGAAMDRLGGTLRLDNVTLLATNFVSPREAATDRDAGFDKGAYEAAARTLFDRECPVSYYKSDQPVADGGEFAFVLAHEVFHCVQYRTWPSMLDDGWVSEGTAEYFAYLAHPSFGAGHVAGFDAEIPTHALNTMDYPAVAFYLWMGDARGPESVREFIASARSIQSAIDADMWLEFAQRYFDQTIHMPDGRPMPSAPRRGGVVNINSDQRIGYPPIVPYTLNNTTLAFARDKTYTLTHQTSPPDFRERWREDAGGSWQEMPATVSTCAGEKRYRVIWTTTRSTNAGAIDVRAQPAAPGTCSCPAGTWSETPESLRHMMEQSALGASETRFIAGGRTLQLNPDHTGSFTYNGVITETHSSDPRVWLRQTKTGGTHFTWRVVNGTLLTILSPGDNLLNLYNEQHVPGGVHIENRRAGAQSIGHMFVCEGNMLHLTQRVPASPYLPPGFNVNMDFQRMGGAPEPGSGH